ncbi:MAG: BON domain-containing protein [Gammaproteobacteria bacterium]|nr:BON domain-containing protein [Gammaproteobacteria bacterium]
MTRWLALLIIGALVVFGVNGCVLVVADENVAQEVREDKHRSRLARDIARDIDGDESLMDSDISVREHDGVVTLRGEVDRLSSLQHAIDIVARHPDVETVISHLTVEVEF